MNQDGIDQQLRDIAASTITRLNPENKIIAITIHTTEGSKRRVAEIVYRTGDVDSAIIVDQFGQTSFSEIFWEQERQIAKAKYGKIDRVLNDALPGLLRSVEQIEVEIAVAATITPPTLVAVLADARVSMDVYDSWRLTHANKLVALFDSQKVELRAWL